MNATKNRIAIYLNADISSAELTRESWFYYFKTKSNSIYMETFFDDGFSVGIVFKDDEQTLGISGSPIEVLTKIKNIINASHL